MQAVDARTGQAQWGPLRPNTNATITGAPAAILQQYDASRDLVLVPTRNNVPTSPSDLYGLSLTDGSNVSSFNGGGTMGPINGTPAVDYATNRVYVVSRRLDLGDTVWCVQVSATDPALSPTPVWSHYLGDFDTSPVLRNGRIYVGNTAGTVYSLDMATGGDERTFSTRRRAGEGLPLPGPAERRPDLRDRHEGVEHLRHRRRDHARELAVDGHGQWPHPLGRALLAADEPRVRREAGTAGSTSSTSPTPPRRRPRPHKVLVLGDGLGQIGAPTLDIGVDPPDVTAGKKLLVVGSESGVLYGVEVPF